MQVPKKETALEDKFEVEHNRAMAVAREYNNR